MAARKTADLLRGSDVLHIKADNELALIEAVQEGLSVTAVDEVVQRYELSTAELEEIIPRRTLARRRNSGGVLNTEESNRLERLVRVFAQAEDSFGSIEKARLWMRRENRSLRGRTPMEIINTDRGARLIEQLLGRMAHGVYS